MALPLSPGTFGSAAGMPRIELSDGRILDRPHPEWVRHQLRWRWLLDSWEGGEAYRTAVYGTDARGMPVRNLIRHKREYPGPGDPAHGFPDGRGVGTDQAAGATADDYELRRARTPVPTFTADAVKAHLSRIFAREITRDGPEPLKAFWANVTGKRESIDAWWSQTAAPLFLTLGQLDLLVDHPAAPDGEAVSSRADELRLGLDKAVVSIVLPENLVWWRLDRLDRYAECLVREPDDDGSIRWRHWDATGWILWDHRGKRIEADAHPFGRPPIVRIFDRKRPRSRNVGLPRYEPIAELQREFYNRDSELILSDTTQAHPLLQGPEDYVNADGSIPLGPNWLLPKKKDPSNGTYEGFETVDFSKTGAESIRLNKADLRDAVDRAALLVKPAGAAGTNGRTVAQSGLSKRLDQAAGNDLLREIADVLAAGELALAELALLVASDGRADATGKAEVRVNYPSQFDLATADELAAGVAEFQSVVAGAGTLPETEFELLSRLVRLMVPGLDDGAYGRFDAEIKAHVQSAADRESRDRESIQAIPPSIDAYQGE